MNYKRGKAIGLQENNWSHQNIRSIRKMPNYAIGSSLFMYEFFWNSCLNKFWQVHMLLTVDNSMTSKRSKAAWSQGGLKLQNFQRSYKIDPRDHQSTQEVTVHKAMSLNHNINDKKSIHIATSLNHNIRGKNSVHIATSLNHNTHDKNSVHKGTSLNHNINDTNSIHKATSLNHDPHDKNSVHQSDEFKIIKSMIKTLKWRV